MAHTRADRGISGFGQQVMCQREPKLHGFGGRADAEHERVADRFDLLGAVKRE
jgi:hypothetical protein